MEINVMVNSFDISNVDYLISQISKVGLQRYKKIEQ